MALGRHHQHLRRRLYKNLQPYPHPQAALRWLDRIVYVAGFVGPACTIPQIAEIFMYGNAAGVSVISWGAYAILDIPWIIYGMAHRERVITFTYSLWFLANTAVAIGAWIY